MMKMKSINNASRIALSGTLLLASVTAAAQPSPRLVEQSFEWHQQAIVMRLNIPQSVTIEVWDQPTIRAQAKVVLRDDRGDISEDFRWRMESGQEGLQLKADFGARVGHTVVLENGSDVRGGIGKDVTLTATELTITIPSGAKLDVSSQSGSMHIEHPGNTLLVNGNGNVEITVADGIDFTFNSMLGNLSLDPALTVKGLKAAQGDHPRSGNLEINGGGAQTSVVTVVGNISLVAKRDRRAKLSKRQLLQDFDQAIQYIDQFAGHADLNARRLGIDHRREFQRLRSQITSDTDLCGFNTLLKKALNLVQDGHASTMSYDYFSQYGRYQKKYNFEDSESYASQQRLEAECPERAVMLDLPIMFSAGKYLFYADFNYRGSVIPRGAEITLYQGEPVEAFITQHPEKVSPIRISAVDGRRYSTRFYRYGEPQFSLTLNDGREIELDLSESIEWVTPRQREVSYGSQAEHRVMYFDQEHILLLGIPMMDEALVAIINSKVDAIAARGVPIDKVIIDIRGNPGGSDATWHGVISHLLKKELRVNLDMRFKDNAATRAYYGAESSAPGVAIALLGQQQFWRHPNHGLSLALDAESIDFRGKIYLLQDEFIYSSAGNFSNFARLDEQIVSVGGTTDLVGGAQIEPLFFKLDHSGLFFRLEPVLDFLNVEALPDFAHNAGEMTVAPNVEDYFLRSTFPGDIHAEDFLRGHDPLFRYVARL